MEVVPNQIRLATTTADQSPGNAPRQFLDFVIDGQPLAPTVRRAFDLISPFWLDLHFVAASVNAARRLLGELEPDAPNERVSVYVCSSCGDLGCGALTVELTMNNQLVR